jgi:hypothetical protein
MLVMLGSAVKEGGFTCTSHHKKGTSSPSRPHPLSRRSQPLSFTLQRRLERSNVAAREQLGQEDGSFDCSF